MRPLNSASALHSGTNLTLTTDAGDLGLLGRSESLGAYSEVFVASEQMEIFGMMFNVLTLQGLIKAKKTTRRAKDLLLVPELEALIQLRKTHMP
jgi:hypothetical protein